MAVRVDGTLWTWGSNSNGQLGTGVAVGTSFASPAQEWTKAKSWVSTYGRQDTSIAARVDGSVWGWGNNGSGQLGLGDTTTRNTPTQLTWTMSPPVTDLTVTGLSNDSIRQGVVIPLTAAAAGGRITKVDFYYGNTLISTDTSSPYAASWNTANVAPGSYAVRARGWNALGESTWSAPVTVKIVKVVISSAAAPSSVNLTTDGNIDWVHYGLKNATTVERKNVANHPLSVSYFHKQTRARARITIGSCVDTSRIASRSTGRMARRTPSPMRTGPRQLRASSPQTRIMGADRYSLTADVSGTADRVVSLYFKNVNANVNLSFSVDGAETTATWTNSNGGTGYRVYRVTYRGADASQYLKGELSFGTLGSGGTLVFLGATLH